MPGCNAGSREVFLQQIMEEAEKAVAEVIREMGLTDRYGGYIRLTENGVEAIAPSLVGRVENGRDEKYQSYATEKSDRLWLMFGLHGHRLSSQSRDEANEKYGGAVLFDDGHGHVFILSFSGLPEIGDEAAMLLTGARVMDAMDQAVLMTTISNNETFLKLAA
jgi:hypothetical protein